MSQATEQKAKHFVKFTFEDQDSYEQFKTRFDSLFHQDDVTMMMDKKESFIAEIHCVERAFKEISGWKGFVNGGRTTSLRLP